jgi:hypothetical protein
MLTCFIRYEIDPFKRTEFEHYSRVWGEAIPRCGADLIGLFRPTRGLRHFGVRCVQHRKSGRLRGLSRAFGRR